MKAEKINPELFDSEKYNENLIKESADTLLEAEEIKKDKFLMDAIEKHWEKQDGKIKSLQDLKDKANNMTGLKKDDAGDE